MILLSRKCLNSMFIAFQHNQFMVAYAVIHGSYTFSNLMLYACNISNEQTHNLFTLSEITIWSIYDSCCDYLLIFSNSTGVWCRVFYSKDFRYYFSNK